MKTRQQYLDGKCTHSEYYGQFVTKGLKEDVKRWIGEDKILKSENEHFNDIPLHIWDSFMQVLRHYSLSAKLKEVGDAGLTLAGCVCIAKEAARQIKAEATKP